jgi:hypothetical protein
MKSAQVRSNKMMSAYLQLHFVPSRLRLCDGALLTSHAAQAWSDHTLCCRGAHSACGSSHGRARVVSITAAIVWPTMPSSHLAWQRTSFPNIAWKPTWPGRGRRFLGSPAGWQLVGIPRAYAMAVFQRTRTDALLERSWRRGRKKTYDFELVLDAPELVLEKSKKVYIAPPCR